MQTISDGDVALKRGAGRDVAHCFNLRIVLTAPPAYHYLFKITQVSKMVHKSPRKSTVRRTIVTAKIIKC